MTSRSVSRSESLGIGGFSSEIVQPQKSTTALSSYDYKIVLTITRFKIPKNIAGGKKTCRNRRRNRKTNRRIRKYY